MISSPSASSNSSPTPSSADRPAWAAVFSMSLGVFGLVGAEFLPASLLTPLAADLRVSEGLAGQAVTATAGVALITSLLITVLTRKIDRRQVLLGFSILLIISNLIAAMAPNLTVLLFARVLLGMALGGFWTLSAATTMRLVPEEYVPRALSIMFAGVSAATVFAAPVGSYLGDLLGWRAVFIAASGLGVLAFAIQFFTLPSLPPRGHSRLGTLIELLTRPVVSLAMLSILLVFTGHFGFFTYLRPFLETVTGVSATGVSAILLVFGVGNFIGNSLAGFIIERSMRATLATMPLIMAVLALGLSLAGGNVVTDTVMAAAWGIAFGAVPVAWSTWITRAVPDEAESAGGLFVAAVNLAIALGASGGGAIFDMSGAKTVFLTSGVVLALAFIAIVAGVETRHAQAAQSE